MHVRGVSMENSLSNDDQWKSNMIIDILKAVNERDEDRADKLFIQFAAMFFKNYAKQRSREIAAYHESGAIDRSLSNRD